MIGKWHLENDPTGFDYWNILPGQGEYHDPDMIEMGETIKQSGYVTDIITDKSLDWIKERDVDKPFLLMLQHKAPHMLWETDEKHATLYENETIPEPETLHDDYSSRTDGLKESTSTIAKHLNSWMHWEVPKGLSEKEKTSWLYQKYIKAYLRTVASLDDNIGRVLNYLEESGLKDNTIVVYTSDQGFFLGDHGLQDKRFMYEESLHMPLLVRYPQKIKAGSVNSDMVLNLDFAPTFLDFAGIDIPGDIQGKSLKPLLIGKTPADWRKSMYYHYSESWMVKPHYGVRTERYKLLHYYYGMDAWELYDLENDPNELNNLYSNKEYADLIKELKAELSALQKEYKELDLETYKPYPYIKVDHKAVGCDVSLKYPYSQRYIGRGKNALTDGIHSSGKQKEVVDYSPFQGFEHNDMEATIDLKKVTGINKITSGYLHNFSDWVCLPKKVEYSISHDGKNFKKLGSLSYKILKDTPEMFRHEFSRTFENVEARYIRVLAKNIKSLPAWHEHAGGKAWIFADEIVVE